MTTLMSFPRQQTAKSQRVLACVLCQQRKVKCQRTFPCSNCVRAGVQCEQATRQRRRRFPERELLARLRHYEGLLRQHNIKFNPLHTSTTDDRSLSEDELPDSAQSEGAPLSTEKMVARSRPVNIWRAMGQRTADPKDDGDENNSGFLHDNDDVRHAVIKRAWNHTFQGRNNDHLLLFGSPLENVDLSASHPSQVQIFRLWQVYLDNINPLLKVTHTPTLQARIIDAAGDVANIKPTLEALMFSIYCVSILSLTEDQCSAFFGSLKKDLLAGYQFSCQQALRRCCVLKSSDRECLTALYLYLISIRPEADPASLSSLLSVAIRIAQRIGIHNESMYGKCSALEAEMRRRLWWSLVIFDDRICEMSDIGATSLTPTWDCRVPLNVNDSELQPEMKAPPATDKKPTEMLFAVVRSELADFIRRSAFYLDFINPSLNTMVSRPSTTEEVERLMALEKALEEKYLAFCNLENPLHYMTTWKIRGSLAKYRLLQHYSRYSTTTVEQTDAQRNFGVSHALRILECDTNLMASPYTKRYLWLIHFHFPFPAYIHLLQDLKRRPIEEHSDKAWEIMSRNYEVRITDTNQEHRPFFIVFSRIVLHAWEARESITGQENHDKPLVPPRIVSDIRKRIMQMTMNFPPNTDTAPPSGSSGAMQMDFDVSDIAYSVERQEPTGLSLWGYPEMSGSSSIDVDPSQFLLSTMHWDAIYARST